MRQMLSLAVVSALVLATVSCRESNTSTAPVNRSGDFRVLIPSRPATLNPNLNFDEVAIVVGRSLFNQLVTLNESGRLLPDLAESWTTSADGLTYTFKLQSGVRWHDGAPFTSADVRWTLETVARDRFVGAAALTPVASIETPDSHTVVITLKHPWAPFATDLAGPGMVILPRHVYEESDWRTHAANQRPIGTGPFKFGEWLNDATLVLEANANYFRSGPYVERVIFDVTPPDASADKLLRGQADYAVIRPSSMDPSRQPPEPIQLRSLPSSARVYLAMNLRRAPFSDVRVRRAIASAIDQLEVVSKGLGGLGAPAVGWYTPDVEWAYNAAVRVPDYDVAAARRLLDAAGLRMKNGVRLRASFAVPNASPLRDVADLLQKQLAAVGIRVVVEQMSTEEWIRRMLDARDFDLTLVSGAQGPDPDQLRRRFLATTETGAFIGYDDPEFREAVEQGARVADVAERAAAYHRAQEILARDVPFVPLAESVRVITYNRRVTGLPQLEARGLVGAFDFSLVKLGATRADSSR